MTDIPTRGTAVLSGRYALEQLIGQGGMAEVYRAEDRVLGRPVAVKLLRDVTADPAARARFTAEAQTLARLSHPGLVTVLDAGTDGNRPYLVMELVQGSTLAGCCTGVALDPQYVAAVGAQVGDALGYVHSRGIVHRDVKPSNVLLGDDGRVLLADFGIAKLAAEAAPLTATDSTVGTAWYLAPEQVRRGDIGPATDVYSLGLVLLEALTGQQCYPGSPIEAAVARLSSPPAIPATLPAPLAALLRRMSALDPADRPELPEVVTTLRHLAAGVDASTAAVQPHPEPATTAPLTPPVPSDHPATALLSERPAGGRHAVPAAAVPRWSGLTTRRQLRLGGALLVAVLLLVLGAALLTSPDAPDHTSEIPPNLPSNISRDLQDLHDAVNG